MVDGKDDVLAVVPVAEFATFEYITYRAINEKIESRRLSKNPSNTFYFKLLHSNGTFLDLNNLDFEMTLFIYEDTEETLQELMKKFSEFMDLQVKVFQKIENLIEEETKALESGSS